MFLSIKKMLLLPLRYFFSVNDLHKLYDGFYLGVSGF